MTETQEKKFNAGRVRSMNKIANALLELISDGAYESVTVTEICNRAKVARKTFYRSFDSKDAVIVYRLENMFAELAAKYDFAEAESRELLLFCFEYLERDRMFANMFVDSGLYELIVRKMMSFVQIAYDNTLHNSASFEPAYGEYYYKFISVGFISLVHTWIESGFKMPAATLVALARRLLSGVLA